MVITTTDMKILETNTVALGIPLKMLMEAAGKSVADTITNQFSPEKANRVIVLMGKGGNGGDSLVASRYLASRGFSVDVLPAYSPSEILHPDTRYNYEVVKRIDSIKIHKPGDLSPLDEADIIIDGLLGTGVRGEVRDPVKTYIVEANRAKAKLKVAIDAPSGLDPDTGEVHGVAFKADITVTFHDIKPGLREKVEYTGKVVVANIGVPREAYLYIGPGDVVHGIPKRPRDTHKGMAGKIMVVGGSYRFTGAPALAGLAALASGSDLVFIVSPDTIRSIIASYSPELITLPYEGKYLSVEDLGTIDKYIEQVKPHVVVIGPGLSDRPETIEAVNKLLDKVLERDIYLVIDADALKAIKIGDRKFNGKAVLTPHRGEFKRLSGIKLSGDLVKDAREVLHIANKLEATILLKAPIDIISNGLETRYNKTGNPYMSIGGTGDVLSGLTASILAKTHVPFKSACIASYLNGLAGDYLLKHGEKVSPAEIIRVIPHIMREPLNIHIETYLEG